jgi:hypothetical protein
MLGFRLEILELLLPEAAMGFRRWSLVTRKEK